MKTTFRSGQPVSISGELLGAMHHFLTDILPSKSVTKGEIKVMGYLLSKALQGGTGKEKGMRITAKDWQEEAGLAKGEADKALAKCEEKGWISVDTGEKPSVVRLIL